MPVSDARCRHAVTAWRIDRHWSLPAGLDLTRQHIGVSARVRGARRRLGRKRLDALKTEDVQRLKQQLHDRAAKTVNNVLTVLNVLLKTAVSWDVIERMPCSIRLLPVPISAARFLDFDEYERLLTAASTERDAHLTVLLGGEAGCVVAR